MTTPPAPGTAGGGQQAPAPVFETVEDWMDGYFLPMYRRPLGGEFRWCPRWWAHPEAVSRLTALWRSWEACRLEPATGISDWYRDHLDHHLPILLGARGPFYQCDPGTGHLDSDPFPTDEIDYDALDDAAASAEDGTGTGDIGDTPGAGW
jgi:hypothetical protein